MKPNRNVIAVLSHLMDEQCRLNDESKARAEKAIALCKSHDYELLMTSGWAYRSDVERPIGEVMASYICPRLSQQNVKIVADIYARDTVGDAFFLRKRLQKTKLDKLTVITSNYHVNRTNIIFNSFFKNLTNIAVVGVPTTSDNDLLIRRHEEESIQAFERTFNKVDISNDNEVLQALKSNHPFYNGEHHSVFNYTDSTSLPPSK